MFFIYLSVPIFFIFYFYKKYFTLSEYNLSFTSNNKHKFFLQSIEQYSENFKEIHTIIYNKYASIENKIDINIQNYTFNIINYTYNNKTYKSLIKSSVFKFPIEYNIENYVYLNKLKNAEIKFKTDNNIDIQIDKVDITNLLLKYIGPNYNFNYDTEFKQNIKDILMIEGILTEENIKYIEHIKLIDNFDNEINIENELKWKPSII